MNDDTHLCPHYPTSHCLHAGQLLACYKLHISYIHILSSSAQRRIVSFASRKINRLASNKGFNIDVLIQRERF